MCCTNLCIYSKSSPSYSVLFISTFAIRNLLLIAVFLLYEKELLTVETDPPIEPPSFTDCLIFVKEVLSFVKDSKMVGIQAAA